MMSDLATEAFADSLAAGNQDWESSSVCVAARNRFFPGWFAYSTLPKEWPSLPIYRIECATDEDFELARRVQPRFLNAEIVRRA